MIVKRASEEQNVFHVIGIDTITKQQLADKEEITQLKVESCKLVAQEEIEYAAGFLIEDDQGRIHKIGYKVYTDLKIDKLFLPPIQHSNPSMTLEEALVVIAKFSNKYVTEKMENHAFELPKEFIIAREVLGGRSYGMKVFEALVNVVKART